MLKKHQDNQVYHERSFSIDQQDETSKQWLACQVSIILMKAAML